MIQQFYNQISSKAVINCITNNANILELGAGIGSVNHLILSFIQKNSLNVSYTYTDISSAFLSYGSRRFKHNFDFVNFKKFDINASSCFKNFEKSYDIIFAGNVLHNAINIRNTLILIYHLLKPGGYLIINEPVVKNDYSTLIYGLASGWWDYEDVVLRFDDGPLLSEEVWCNLLKDVGFSNIYFVLKCQKKLNQFGQDVIVACRGG